MFQTSCVPFSKSLNLPSSQCSHLQNKEVELNGLFPVLKASDSWTPIAYTMEKYIKVLSIFLKWILSMEE